MAIIYDMLTGKVISEESLRERTDTRSATLQTGPALQAHEATGNPSSAAACSAYMVLLERLLKDL